MVVVTTTIRELARPLVKIIQEAPKSEWVSKIKKLPIIQKLVSETEISTDEKLNRISLMTAEVPLINDTAYGLTDKEWQKFVRKFFGSVEKCDKPISDNEHVQKCDKVAEAFLIWEELKTRWQVTDKRAHFYLSGKKVEGTLKLVIMKYFELIIATLYYLAKFSDISSVSLKNWPKAVVTEEVKATEIEAQTSVTVSQLIDLIEKRDDISIKERESAKRVATKVIDKWISDAENELATGENKTIFKNILSANVKYWNDEYWQRKLRNSASVQLVKLEDRLRDFAQTNGKDYDKFIKIIQNLEIKARALPEELNFDCTIVDPDNEIKSQTCEDNDLSELLPAPFVSSENRSYIVDPPKWNEKCNLKEFLIERVDSELVRGGVRKFSERCKAIYYCFETPHRRLEFLRRFSNHIEMVDTQRKYINFIEMVCEKMDTRNQKSRMDYSDQLRDSAFLRQSDTENERDFYERLYKTYAKAYPEIATTEVMVDRRLRDFVKGLSNPCLKEFIIKDCYDLVFKQRNTKQLLEKIESFYEKERFCQKNDLLEDSSMAPIRKSFDRHTNYDVEKKDKRNKVSNRNNDSRNSGVFDRAVSKELRKLCNNANVDINGKLKIKEKDIPSWFLRKSDADPRNFVSSREKYFELVDEARNIVMKNIEEGPVSRRTLKNRRKRDNYKRNKNVSIEKRQSSSSSESSDYEQAKVNAIRKDSSDSDYTVYE